MYFFFQLLKGIFTDGVLHPASLLFCRFQINASGHKVWPAEVESLMFRHPAIQEACVIGTKDDYRGESVKAVVVLRPSHRDLVTEQDIIDWCHENMAVYKAPRVVQFVEALPKSGTGKVMWRQLQEAEKAPRAAPID